MAKEYTPARTRFTCRKVNRVANNPSPLATMNNPSRKRCLRGLIAFILSVRWMDEVTNRTPQP